MIEIKDLTVKYKKNSKPTLQNINLKIDKGDFISIIGPSGVGKSTFLKSVCGIYPDATCNFESGKILIDNEEPRRFRKKHDISYVSQDYSLFEWLNVSQNINLSFRLKPKDNHQSINELLEIFRLNYIENILLKKIDELSGGQKTRIELIRALISNPDILILDEPFRNLDEGVRSEIFNYLTEYFKQYMPTVIMVTHDHREATKFSSKIFSLKTINDIDDRDGPAGISRIFNVSDLNNSERNFSHS